MKEFSCGDVVPGCQATFRGASDDEILGLVATHAAEVHDMADVPPEVVEVHQRDRDKMLTADFGKLDFEAWKRKLDTVDRSWRE